MPELPEVETIRRQLAPRVEGRVIRRCDVIDERLTAPMPVAVFRSHVEGRRIASLDRRGKYLRFELEGGGALVLHLRMTGRLTLIDGGSRDSRSRSRNGEAPDLDSRYLRLVMDLDSGGRLAFHDMRRLGTATYLEDDEDKAYWEKLGPEPLSRGFSGARLHRILSERKKPVKSALMDQRLIAGIGNIYADESLFRAGIHPQRRASEIQASEVESLCREIKATLREAIRLQGSSIDTYADTSGRSGGFQETFKVHRRAGEPCPGCGRTIEKIKVGGRGTYFCPGCQQ